MRTNHLLIFGVAVCLTLLAGDRSCRGSIVVNIGGGEFRNAGGEPLETGSLLQIVHLGSNGVFDPIDLSDGGSPWVSGDDALLGAAFTTGAGAPADFPSTDAFDFLKGIDTPGTLDRVFEFASNVLPIGAMLGVRWFPNLQAAAFGSTTLQPGRAYGQFTRQQTPQHGGTLWIVPNDGANVTFDPLLTQSFGGMDAADAGRASLVVVPEPATAGLFLLGGGAFLAGRYQSSGTPRT